MKVMILAAGRGERMRPLTDHTPKPLLAVAGKPLIVWHIERLVAAGLRELVINHAHLGQQIVEALGDGSRFGARIAYSAENPALETAGGIAYALPLLGEAPFAVINGDIYCDYDLSQIPSRTAALTKAGDMAHLVLINNPEHNLKGDFGLAHNRVTPLPPCHSPLSTLHSPLPTSYTFSGIGIYQPQLFKHIPHGTAAPLAPLLRAEIAANKVSGEHYNGRWIDVGTPERLQQLDTTLRAKHNTPHE